MVGLPAMLKCFARLPGLRRVEGEQGVLKEVKVEGGFAAYLTEDGSAIWPFPGSLKVFYGDGEE